MFLDPDQDRRSLSSRTAKPMRIYADPDPQQWLSGIYSFNSRKKEFMKHVPTTVAPIMYRLTRMRAFDFACNTHRTNKYECFGSRIENPDPCRTKLDPKNRKK
jgi:hypothetical protein